MTLNVVIPGLGQVLELYMKKHELNSKMLAARLRVTTACLRRVMRDCTTGIELFNTICLQIKEPWQRNYCDLSERPARLSRVVAKRLAAMEDKKYVFRRIKTPSLEDFNGMPGGWC